MALDRTPDPLDPWEPIEQSGPLDRATAAARAEEPAGWTELTDSIMTRVRGLTTPSEPVLAHTPSGEETHDAEGSRTYVASRLVTSSLRRVLQGSTTHAPTRIELDIDDRRLQRVSVSLACSYGTDLQDLADVVRDQVLRELDRLVGADPLRPVVVDVAVVDVVVGDPNLV